MRDILDNVAFCCVAGLRMCISDAESTLPAEDFRQQLTANR